ncbi:CoA transferase, partial [Aeromonas veronii]|nr:CoA transferase [Aeromonas veronii]
CVADRQWQSLLKVMNRQDLLDDTRFQTNVDRSAHTLLVDEIVTSWTFNKKKLDISDVLIEANVPHAPVLSIDEVADDPHLKYRKMIREIEHPVAGRIKVPGSPIRLSDSPLEEVVAAPLIGEHTEEVLHEMLGLTEEQIRLLNQKNIIRQCEKVVQ